LVDHEAQLLDFAVSQDGQGLGQALWLSLLKAAKARGATKISWEVSSANTRALLFYRRVGAKVVGRRVKFYNDGSDAILMDCLLT
jgi:ribosomal-protein-alanine N-acetyltransferase